MVPLQILSCFKISSTKLLALQACSKKLLNPIILTEYLLFSKSTSSTSTKSPLQAENNVFLARTRIKQVNSNENSFFLGRGHSPFPKTLPYPVGRGTPPHTSPQPSLLGPPCVPKIPARFTPLNSQDIVSWAILGLVCGRR